MAEQTQINEILLDLFKQQDNKLDHIAKTVTTVSTQLKEVLGNGKPGRLTVVEGKVEKQQKFLWIALGILGVGGLTEMGAHGAVLLQALVQLLGR